MSQTVADIERGWVLVNKEQHRQLKSLQEKGSKKEVSCTIWNMDMWSGHEKKRADTEFHLFFLTSY